MNKEDQSIFPKFISSFLGNNDELVLLQKDDIELLNYIQSQKIVGITNSHLTNNSNCLSRTFASELKKKALKHTILNLNKIKELVSICKKINDNNINVIAYKGSVLSEQIFLNPTIRHFNDLDLIINKKDFFNANNLLKEMGYKPINLPQKVDKKFFQEKHEVTFINSTNNSKPNIDLHWRLMSKDFFDCDIEYLERNSLTTKINIQGYQFKTLSLDFLPVALAVHHGGTELWRKLKYILDWKYLLENCSEKINWEKTKWIAQDRRVYNFLLISLAIINLLFDTKIPKTLEKDVGGKKIQRASTSRIKYLKENSTKTIRWSFQYWFRIYYKDGNWLNKLPLVVKYFQTAIHKFLIRK